MKSGPILLLLVLVCGASSQDAWKPDTQIGDFQFNMPNGWQKVQGRNGGTLLVPTNLQSGSTAAIDFLPPQGLTTDLRSWFSASWAEWQRQFKVQQAGAIQTQHHPNGFDLLSIDARVSHPQFGYCEFVFAATRVGRKIEAYYFISNAGYYSYRNAFDDFQHSLQFANNPATPHRDQQNPVPAGGGLNGMYVGYRMRSTIRPDESHIEYLVFFPDGNAIRYLPESGIDNFNFRSALRDSRDYCGRYRLSGGQVTIDWANNDTETASRSGDTLKIRGDSYFAVLTDNGLKLNGTYRREGADLARYFIRFAPDGRFAENGILPLLAYSRQNTSPGSGTYSIGNNTLHLNYSDGRKIAFSFFIFAQDEAGEHPGMIHLNTYALLANR